MSTYLLVILLALSFPLILSFDRKVHFYTQWKYLFPSIFLTMIVFIPWDAYFTAKGIWGFNPLHLNGLSIFRLPVEEWLFFIIVPYASLFTYEVLNKYIRRDLLGKYSVYISGFLIFFLLIIAALNFNKAYTSFSFFLTAAFIFIIEYLFKAKYMGRFYLSYLIILIPFLAVNGILTGTFIREEIVWYNNAENLSIRLFTIPIEDAAYGLLLILMNTSFYEFFKGKKILKKNAES